MENQFTWGDAVLVSKEAPSAYHPGEFASICGIDQLITEDEAKKFQCSVGDCVYIRLLSKLSGYEDLTQRRTSHEDAKIFINR